MLGFQPSWKRCLASSRLMPGWSGRIRLKSSETASPCTVPISSDVGADCAETGAILLPGVVVCGVVATDGFAIAEISVRLAAKLFKREL